MADQVRVTAKEWADNLEAGVRRSADKMRKGIERVSEAPGEKAAEAKQKWIDKLSTPEVQDKWASNVAKMPLAEWKRLMTEKGISRAQSGVTAAKGKIENVAEQLIDHQNDLLRKIHAMPKVTLTDSGNRMLDWMHGMAEFRKK